MILDGYFDGTFSDHSHGFRSERGCHTALRDIYQTWKGAVWLIEGDIADCFGSLDHELILSTLGEHIQDGRFLGLVKKLLDAGYLEDWKVRFVRLKPWKHGGRAVGILSLITNFLTLGAIPNLLDGQQTAVPSL